MCTNAGDIANLCQQMLQDEESNKRNFSELDTQMFLVEPILEQAGFDVRDPDVIRRASRNSKAQEFDIEIYDGGNLLLAIEVKSLKSPQYNADKIFEEEKGCGNLSDNQEKGNIENCNGDGVRQLRQYCFSWAKKLSENTIPIITNGRGWVLFELDKFKNKNNLGEKVTEDMVSLRADINKNKDIDKLIAKLKLAKDYNNSTT